MNIIYLKKSEIPKAKRMANSKITKAILDFLQSEEEAVAFSYDPEHYSSFASFYTTVYKPARKYGLLVIKRAKEECVYLVK